MRFRIFLTAIAIAGMLAIASISYTNADINIGGVAQNAALDQADVPSADFTLNPAGDSIAGTAIAVTMEKKEKYSPLGVEKVMGLSSPSSSESVDFYCDMSAVIDTSFVNHDGRAGALRYAPMKMPTQGFGIAGFVRA